MQTVSLSEAQDHLSDLIEAATRGEEVVIANGAVSVQLVPRETPKPQGKRQFGSARGMFVLTPAFDEPIEGFEDYES